MKSTYPLKIVFVDDDEDDHFLFFSTVEEIEIPTELTPVTDSENLVTILLKDPVSLPDIIFLDLNMPKKNGYECLNEIKQHTKLKNIPVVIYSTSCQTDLVDRVYKSGAFYCIRKPARSKQAKELITFVFQSVLEHKIFQPSREKFALGFVEHEGEAKSHQ